MEQMKWVVSTLLVGLENSCVMIIPDVYLLFGVVMVKWDYWDQIKLLTPTIFSFYPQVVKIARMGQMKQDAFPK